MDLLDYRVIELHSPQLSHKLLDSARFGRNEHVRRNHAIILPLHTTPHGSRSDHPHLNSISGTPPVRAISSSWRRIRDTASASGNIFLLICMSASVESGCQNTPSRFAVTSGTRFAMLNTSPSLELPRRASGRTKWSSSGMPRER